MKTHDRLLAEVEKLYHHPPRLASRFPPITSIPCEQHIQGSTYQGLTIK
jgi:hypothetical protein